MRLVLVEHRGERALVLRALVLSVAWLRFLS